MKNRSLWTFPLLVAFTAVVLRASEFQLVSADTASRKAVTQNDPGAATLTESNLLQSVPVSLTESPGNNPVVVFEHSLKEAFERADVVAIQALYQTNGLSANELNLELARWRTWFAEDPKPRYLGMMLRTLSIANKWWEDRVRALTTHEATHLAGVTCRSEEVTGTIEFPLIEVEGRLLLVVSDKRTSPLGWPRVQQDGPADGGQPSSSETNRTSGAAGRHR